MCQWVKMQQAGLGLYTSGVSKATWEAVWHIANVRCTNALQFWMNLCLYLLFNLRIYIMYFYIHTCGGQSKGGLASARGQWFLKGFKIMMIKTKTSCSDSRCPSVANPANLAGFQVVLNGRIGCYWLLATYLCYILTNLSYLLYKCVMTHLFTFVWRNVS
jgi:hypothetical protein